MGGSPDGGRVLQRRARAGEYGPGSSDPADVVSRSRHRRTTSRPSRRSIQLARSGASAAPRGTDPGRGSTPDQLVRETMTKSDPRTQNDQPPPIADLSTFPEAVDGDWTHDELFRLCMVEYPRRLHTATPTERRLILSRRPPLTGTIWDAAIAASIEHGALIHDLRPPEWTDEEHRFLDEPVELLPQTANTVLCHLPAPFTRHGIIIDRSRPKRRTPSSASSGSTASPYSTRTRPFSNTPGCGPTCTCATPPRSDTTAAPSGAGSRTTAR